MAARAALEASDLDHGPIRVHDKMRSMGLEQLPSTASLAWSRSCSSSMATASPWLTSMAKSSLSTPAPPPE
ncbi:hypothetical protein AU194_27445 [Mycobacterium sp. GA-2829]|nr:hypothetical protein AU194_27445 [Mycobacterium sp. GA-2829]